jgi:hypothetical protein
VKSTVLILAQAGFFLLAVMRSLLDGPYHGPRIMSVLSYVKEVVRRYFIWMKNEPSQKETLRRICATAWVPERAFYLGAYCRFVTGYSEKNLTEYFFRLHSYIQNRA